jgi:hypothetical protein
LNTEEAYQILDSSAADNSTWCAGGCAILAHALNIAYGYDIYVIYNKTDEQVEHFGVKTPNNTFIDCDGEQRQWLKNFRRKDFYLHPEKKLSILPFSNDLNITDIVIDMEASRKLAELIKGKNNLNENVQMKNIAYSAVVLTDESHVKLLKVFSGMIPEGWKPYAHHMTLNMGNIDPKYANDLGNEVELTVVDYAFDDLVIAVGVEGYPTNNAKPHITLAVNVDGGGKPFLSNKLTNWKPTGFQIKITGIITEVPR